MENMPYKTVLLTGVAQGLGFFLCKYLAEAGYSIIGIDLPVREQLSPEIHSILTNYYSFDLSDTPEIHKLIRRIIADNGNIHILINNAGMKSFKLLEEYSDNEFRKVVNVNFLAPVLLTKQLIPHMQEIKFGRIINIASNAGFEGYKTGSAYCPTKGALHLFTEAVAPELTKGLTINTISPSTILTPEYAKLNPGISPGRYIAPKKVAILILTIIRSEMNGKVIPVINFKSRLKYLIGDLRKYIYWFTHL